MRIIIYAVGKEKEFERQARAAEKRWKSQNHEVLMVPIDVTQTARSRRKQLENAVGVSSVYTDIVAIYCHGTPNGIDIGWNVGNVARLVDALGPWDSIYQTVCLWCCNTSAGFAPALADEMGMAVLAHVGRGHTTGNPRKWLHLPDGTKREARAILGYTKEAWSIKMVECRTGDFELEIAERCHSAWTNKGLAL
jgi:hypothetical protein